MGFFGFFSFIPDDTPRYNTAHELHTIAFKGGYFQIDKRWIGQLADPFLIFHCDIPDNCFQYTLQASALKRTSIPKDRFDQILASGKGSGALMFDQVNSTVKIARDAFGKVPIYYIYKKGQFLAFSSDLGTLLNNSIASDIQINEGEIYRYLSISAAVRPYSPQTFYRNIFSVLPGRIHSFSSVSTSSKEYIVYNPDKWSHLISIQDYGEEFAHLLTQSVKKATQGKKVLGSQLSGGLDSSSISSIISHLQPDSTLHTFYSDTGSILGDESHYANEMASAIRSKHHVVKPSKNDLDDLIYCTSLYRQPENMALSPSFQISMLKQAKLLNCEALLTGHDGDSIVGSGRNYLPDLFDQGNWDEIIVNLSHIATRENLFPLHPEWNDLGRQERQKLVFIHYFNREKFSNLGRKKVSDIFDALAQGREFLNISFLDIFNHKIQTTIKKLRNTTIYPSSIHSKKLLQYSGNNLSDSNSFFDRQDQKPYYDSILFNQNIRINEEYFALSKAMDLSIHHPFFDVDLYELCLAVPSEFKFGKGYGRGHMREGMAKFLPSAIQNRKNKALFNTYSTEAALRLYNQGRDFLSEKNIIWDFVDQRKFNRAVKLLQHKNINYNMDHLLTFFVNRTLFLSVWLNQK
jgi:asparagine synthase (glutamine-hydrolysing)